MAKARSLFHVARFLAFPVVAQLSSSSFTSFVVDVVALHDIWCGPLFAAAAMPISYSHVSSYSCFLALSKDSKDCLSSCSSSWYVCIPSSGVSSESTNLTPHGLSSLRSCSKAEVSGLQLLLRPFRRIFLLWGMQRLYIVVFETVVRALVATNSKLLTYNESLWL